MPSSITMTNRQKVAAGISILDQDGQPFSELPTGVTASFESSDPNVAPFTVGPDGMNGEVASGAVGQAVITAKVDFPDGQHFEDTLSVAVQNSAPGSINFTVGAPVDE